MGKYKEISNEEDYFSTMLNEGSTNAKQPASCDKSLLPDEKRIEKLCQIALETRNFEINLYWKRTTYYWAFIAADLAAFALVYTRKNPDFQTYMIMAILALCGVLFSVGWFFANKGSKYWQENWENHIGLLVSKYYGPIFKILHHPEGGLINGSPFSVSKINQIISGFVTLVWSAMLIFSIWKIWKVNPSEFCINLLTTIIFIICCLGVFFIIARYARSGTYSAYKKWKKEQEQEVWFYMSTKDSD